jgi:hypothetical protein
MDWQITKWVKTNNLGQNQAMQSIEKQEELQAKTAPINSYHRIR